MSPLTPALIKQVTTMLVANENIYKFEISAILMEINPSILGLNRYEFKAYESLIKLGRSTANKISKNSGVPHGKIYLILDSLLKKGLVDIIPTEPKEFLANNPIILNNYLDEKNKEIELIKCKIEDMKKSYKEDKIFEESNIIVREGKKAFYDIHDNLKRPKHYMYSIKYHSKFHKDWAENQKEEIQKGVDVKVLTRYDDETKKDVKRYLKYNKNMRKIENEGFSLSIRDDEEVLIIIIRNNTTILIKDKSFAKIMKKMFLETYNNSEKIK